MFVLSLRKSCSGRDDRSVLVSVLPACTKGEEEREREREREEALRCVLIFYLQSFPSELWKNTM